MNQNLLFTEPVFQLNSYEIQSLQRSVQNTAQTPQRLSDCCFLKLSLPADFCALSYYSSGWGQEFVCRRENIQNAPFFFENKKGRCSAQTAPFFTLSSPSQSIDFAICTSGNYRVTVSPAQNRIWLLITDSNPDFETMLAPGSTFSFPRILAHPYVQKADCYRAKQAYRARHMLSHSRAEALPVIYNHWWAYEDRQVNEDIILQNAAAAKKLGAELLVLDAGWFGNDSAAEDWFEVRGDWEAVNRARFPHGLGWLREQIEKTGLQFGIWCELEGLGARSRLYQQHPEYAAVRDGKSLGYLCFGDAQVREWAYQTMKRLFSACGSTYWKLDFNLDPMFGCDNPAHGHGRQDGLYAHYQGLYQVLDRLRSDFPELIIENCSSGGQRLNMEMASHTHVHFLSDPDYSTHQMRIFKEASKWLQPRELLHFMWSNTVSTDSGAPFPGLNPDLCNPEEIAYHMRLAMMHQLGISHRLIEYAPQTLALMKKHLSLYQEIIRPFISCGSYLPLYLSEHTNIFSFSRRDAVLVFLFAEQPDLVEWGLSEVPVSSDHWILTDLDAGTRQELTVQEAASLTFDAAAPWSSRLLLFKAGS